MDIKTIAENAKNCNCAREHLSSLKGVEIHSRISYECGQILKKYNFPKKYAPAEALT